MLTRFGSHFRHNVAYLALFFALGGSALAAKPLITGADVQNGSLTGADVSDDSTLKGVDIDEADLGKVPSAQNANFATDADKVDGLDATQIQRRVTESCASGQAVKGVAEDGGVDCVSTGTAPGPGARATGTVDQAIPHGIATTVELSQETFDTGNLFTPGQNRLTASVAGTYLVTGQVEWDPVGPVPEARYLELFATGGSTPNGVVARSQDNAGVASASVSTLVRLPVGGWVSMRVAHNAGSDLTLMGGESRRFLAMQAVGS